LAAALGAGTALTLPSVGHQHLRFLRVEKRSHLKFRTFIRCKVPNIPCPSRQRVRVAAAHEMHLLRSKHMKKGPAERLVKEL
jgi:hypothetical protein